MSLYSFFALAFFILFFRLSRTPLDVSVPDRPFYALSVKRLISRLPPTLPPPPPPPPHPLSTIFIPIVNKIQIDNIIYAHIFHARMA